MTFVFKLSGAVKNYEWGKLGLQSAVAFLQKSGSDDFCVDEKSAYAEMWIGTHTSGPATIPSLNNIKLLDWLTSHPEALGENIVNAFGNSVGLPFLFKVLSVNKSLSVQAHPDKDTAEKLYKQFPDRYPDDNHKPEMAIAITDFEALCGFRPLAEIKTFFKVIPSLQKIVGLEIANNFLVSDTEDAFKALFTSAMTCPPNVFQPVLTEIVQGFKLKQFDDKLCEDIHNILLKTYEQYPGDIGCFCLFFLNYLALKPNEAIFLAANVPHAYLFGDCVECMACSDNVVRAGLTPKFRDVDTLCNILGYSCKTSDENKFVPIIDPNDPCVKIYDPPVKEFAVDSIYLEQKQQPYRLKVLKSASVVLVVKGNGSYKHENEHGDIVPGTILFISSGCQAYLSPASQLLAFRAYSNA